MVDKIVNKGRWFFRGLEIAVRRWVPTIGRLNMLKHQGQRWVLIFGIPVHFRSEVVFRDIGDACGGFLEGQETGFSAVRLKVLDVGSLPSSIFLSADGISFEVKVIEEPCFSVPMDSGKGLAESAGGTRVLPSVTEKGYKGEASFMGAAAKAPKHGRVRGRGRSTGPSSKPTYDVVYQREANCFIGPLLEPMDFAFSRLVADKPYEDLICVGASKHSSLADFDLGLFEEEPKSSLPISLHVFGDNPQGALLLSAHVGDKHLSEDSESSIPTLANPQALVLVPGENCEDSSSISSPTTTGE
ncbi:hypothetical protein LINPERPRIM_LOCUS36166 [Linum perenne]